MSKTYYIQDAKLLWVERDRVWYWKTKCINPLTRKKYSWRQAMRATLENPRGFERYFHNHE